MASNPEFPESIEIRMDHQNTATWDTTLAQFRDATVYQSFGYGVARWGGNQVSTLAVFRGGKAISAAMVRQTRAVLGFGGIAHIGWGPAWRPREGCDDLDNLRLAIRALRREYAIRQRRFLRIIPNIYTESEHPARRIFAEEGFTGHPRHEQTILVDLSPSLAELRAQLRRSWRQLLVKAEKAGLEVIQGTGIELYDEALAVYRQMHIRKQFVEFVDKNQFRSMQAALPEGLKMQILLVREGGEPVAALAWAAIGDTGLPLLAATGARALKNNAANLMWWRMLEWLKSNGLNSCDLGGIDPVQNPGGFTFKTGISGDAGRTVSSLGEFVCCTSPISRGLVFAGFAARSGLRRLRLLLEKRRQSRTAKLPAKDGTSGP
jgi:hypothetical protein